MVRILDLEKIVSHSECETIFCRSKIQTIFFSFELIHFFYQCTETETMRCLKHLLPFSEYKIHTYDEIESILGSNKLTAFRATYNLHN